MRKFQKQSAAISDGPREKVSMNWPDDIPLHFRSAFHGSPHQEICDLLLGPKQITNKMKITALSYPHTMGPMVSRHMHIIVDLHIVFA